MKALIRLPPLLAAATWLLTAGATAQTTPGARLAGSFSLAGRITQAEAIPGEHVGQVVSRIWTFAPTCATGPCNTIVLTRPRPRGSDRVLLTWIRPGVYSGSSRFYAPLGCGTRLYRPGERVPFRITVSVATVTVENGTPTVTRIAATYVSPRRDNLTPCVGVLGHDAARYHGYLIPAS